MFNRAKELLHQLRRGESPLIKQAIRNHIIQASFVPTESLKFDSLPPHCVETCGITHPDQCPMNC